MTISITRLEARSLIALDMSSLVSEDENIGAIARDVGLVDRLEKAGVIYEVRTRTPRTWGMDRLERHTLSHRIVDQLPIGVQLTTSLSQNVARSDVDISSMTIIKSGVLVIEGRTTVHTEAGIGAADAVEELRVARRVVDTLSETIFREAVRVLHADNQISATDTFRGLVEDRSGRFDIYDFDAHLSDNPSAGWEGLLKNHPARQELVGLIRLSRPGVWQNYGEAFIQNFITNVDLGNRTDDLWAVYGRRLFRRHPEAVLRQDVQDYFDDVGIVTAVLLASEASLETLAERFATVSPEILQRIGSGRRHASHVSSVLAEAVEALPAAIAPSRVHQHFGHPFFQTLSTAIESSLGLSMLRDAVQQHVSGFLGAASAVAANSISTASLRSAWRIEWLTIAAVILSIAVLALSVLQFLNLTQSGGQP